MTESFNSQGSDGITPENEIETIAYTHASIGWDGDPYFKEQDFRDFIDEIRRLPDDKKNPKSNEPRQVNYHAIKQKEKSVSKQIIELFKKYGVSQRDISIFHTRIRTLGYVRYMLQNQSKKEE